MGTQDTAIISEAEGYFELGLLDEAWNRLDDLPSERQVHFPVLALRLRILIGAQSWVKAEILGQSLVQVMPDNAGAWYALAQAQAQLGQGTEAKASLKRACSLNEALRQPALNDKLLDALW